MSQRVEARYTYAAGPANGVFRAPINVHTTQGPGEHRTLDPEQPQQIMVAPLPGALARSATAPLPSPAHGTDQRTPSFRAPLQGTVSHVPQASRLMSTSASSQSSLASGGSFNASYVNAETKRMRRLSASTSFNQMMDLKDRVRSKAVMIGALNRDAKDTRAAHGDELGASSQHDELQGDRCAEIMERNWCCGRCKPIEADGRFRRWWDAAQVVLLLYVAIMVPLRTGVDDRGLMMEP
eukprot:COSAG02_NODE_18944_length_909_cov_1.080247_1_plen_237_part_01